MFIRVKSKSNKYLRTYNQFIPTWGYLTIPMLFPFKSHILQLDLAGLIWFEPATANLNCGCKACQMPSVNFHYYLVTKLNANVTSGTRKLHCYVVKFRFTSLYSHPRILTCAAIFLVWVTGVTLWIITDQPLNFSFINFDHFVPNAQKQAEATKNFDTAFKVDDSVVDYLFCQVHSSSNLRIGRNFITLR